MAPAWFGPPPELPKDLPPPHIDPEPTQMWSAKPFSKGDLVRMEDVVYVVTETFDRGTKVRLKQVTKGEGEGLEFGPFLTGMMERVSLLDVLAEESEEPKP